MGRAIRNLREKLNRGSQTDLGNLAGVTRQAWGAYEKGGPTVVLDELTQIKIANALGITRDELLRQYELELGSGGPEAPRAMLDGPRSFDASSPHLSQAPILALINAATARSVRMPDDTLAPWANSGTLIIYDTGLWPRKGEGCVIEQPGGALLIKIFHYADEETFHLKELHPEPRDLIIARTEGVRAYRITARID